MTTKPKKRGKCGCYMPRMEGHDFTCRFHPEKVARTKKRKRGKMSEREKAFREAAKLVPHTWLDDLLSGPGRVIGDAPFTGKDIENLLRSVKDRIESAAIRGGKRGS